MLGNRHKCEILDKFHNLLVDHPSKLHIFDGHTKVHGLIHDEAVYKTFSNRFSGQPCKRPRDVAAETSVCNKAPRMDSNPARLQGTTESTNMVVSDDEQTILKHNDADADSSRSVGANAIINLRLVNVHDRERPISASSFVPLSKKEESIHSIISNNENLKAVLMFPIGV